MEKRSYGYFSKESPNRYIAHVLERGKVICGSNSKVSEVNFIAEDELSKFAVLCERCMDTLRLQEKNEIDDLVKTVRLLELERELDKSHLVKLGLMVKFHNSMNWSYLVKRLEEIW